MRSLALAAALATSGCHHASAPLDDDAYVWQRQWTPALAQAMRTAAPDIHAWRILAAQTDRQGHLHGFTPDTAVLAASRRPLILVIRVDGQLAHWDEDRLLREVLAVRDHWPGPAPVGIEIDHDAGTARLHDYARFLARLKPALHGASLSITALPTWLDDPVGLDAVLAVADKAVLQVHAVQSPHAGLFDPALAAVWIERFAEHAPHVFRVALPTYASRVSFDQDGRVLGVESEVPNLAGGASFSELAARPAIVAAFVQQLRRAPPSRLAGFVWFRLPTDEDSRAWSLSTWHAVMRGLPLSSALSVRTRAGVMTGSLDIYLRNDGDLDAALPAAVRLPASCAVADGINGYALVMAGERALLQRRQDGWLHAGRERVIGWARCRDAMPVVAISSSS